MKLRTSVFPASWDAQQKAGDVANVVEEDVTGVRVVKGFGQEARELDRLTDRSRTMFASRVRLVNITARLQPAMQTIPRSDRFAVLALGGWLALHGRITLGTFLAFSTYMLLITPPIRQLAAILTVGQLARAGAERIYDLLDSTPLGAGRARRDRPRGAARRGAVRARDVRLHVGRSGAARLRSHGRVRRDGRARRQLRIGQVDRRVDAAAVLRRARRADHHRRRRRARRPPRFAAPQHRRRVRGLVPLLRHDHGQHRLRPARRDAREIEAAARAAEAHEFIRASPTATTRSSASRA